VVVVGGGIIGVSAAYFLARGGADVVLLEAAGIGAGASSGNAGTIAVGHPPLNRPGRVAQGMKQMLDSTSPLYIQPRLDPGLWRWLARFARYCTEEHVEHCMSVLAPLGREALRAFDDVRLEERIECEYSAGGYYEVCSTEQGLETARTEAALMERYGYSPDVLEPEEMCRREPALTAGIAGAIHYQESASLDPALFLGRMARAAERLGAVIRQGATVRKVLAGSSAVEGVAWSAEARGPMESEPADVVVLATGATARGLVRPWMRALPVQPGKGYHRDIDIGPNGAPKLRQPCVLAESSVFCTPMDTRVRFAGTMEFSGENHRLRPERLSQLTNAARAAFPGMGTARPISEWCGLRPMSVDGLPIVGAVPGVEGLHVATGHGMLGLTLGPVTGRMLARDILSVEPANPALSPIRFA
jgi:D-amino-acid dehydrogenase